MRSRTFARAGCIRKLGARSFLRLSEMPTGSTVSWLRFNRGEAILVPCCRTATKSSLGKRLKRRGCVSRVSALAEKNKLVFYEFRVKYQHDRTGWMSWPEGLPVSAIAPTKTGARRKLRGAVRAYFRSTLRHGDPLPPPPKKVPVDAETIMVCTWPS